MKKFSWLQSGTAWVLSLSALSSLATGALGQSVQAQTRLSDIQGIWANRCIESLADRRIVNGYPDGTFRPNSPVTRAEFATLVGAAFPNQRDNNNSRNYIDVRQDFWAYPAIQKVTRAGFLSGYPDGSFRPSQNIPRVQVLVSLANGLDYRTPPNANALIGRTYADGSAVPSYARNAIAAATTQRIVVNYPNVQQLNPNQSATRAEVAAFLCQALKESRQQALIPARYIAGKRVQNDPSALNPGDVMPMSGAGAKAIIKAEG